MTNSSATGIGTEPALGDRLARLRKEAGLTQAKLSKRVGIARPYLAQIEKGAIPSPDTAVRLARHAGGGAITEIEFALLALDHHQPLAARLVRQYVSCLLSLTPPPRLPIDRVRGGTQWTWDAAYGIIGQSSLFEEVRGLSPQSQWDLVAAVVERESSSEPDSTPEQIRARLWDALTRESGNHGAHVRHAG
jgi:transcriptional regulator with XRE-family HTH domain